MTLSILFTALACTLIGLTAAAFFFWGFHPGLRSDLAYKVIHYILAYGTGSAFVTITIGGVCCILGV